MKKTNENLVILITLFAISIVIANVTGARTITTGLHIGPIELALSGGAITYAVTFLCTDIIGEIWGKATAKRVVKYGFIGQIFATACIMLTGVFPATDAVMDNAYQNPAGAELDLRHRQSVRIPRFPVVGRGRIPCNPRPLHCQAWQHQGWPLALE